MARSGRNNRDLRANELDDDELDLGFAELRDTMREGEALGPLDTDSLEEYDTDSAAMTEMQRRDTDAAPETSDWGETLIHHTAFDEPSAGGGAAEPEVLEVIGSYEVIGRLGYGAMAEVLLARSSGERGFARKVAMRGARFARLGARLRDVFAKFGERGGGERWVRKFRFR